MPGFAGTKLAHDTDVCARYRDVHKIEIADRDRILVEHAGLIGDGGNSGFHALNIAVQFGATRILLIGFDMHEGNGMHWYGRNIGRDMRNPQPNNYARWRAVLDKNAPLLRDMGIDVVNASPSSALTGFRRAGVDQTLQDWAL